MTTSSKHPEHSLGKARKQPEHGLRATNLESCRLECRHTAKDWLSLVAVNCQGYEHRNGTHEKGDDRHPSISVDRHLSWRPLLLLLLLGVYGVPHRGWRSRVGRCRARLLLLLLLPCVVGHGAVLLRCKGVGGVVCSGAVWLTCRHLHPLCCVHPPLCRTSWVLCAAAEVEAGHPREPHQKEPAQGPDNDGGFAALLQLKPALHDAWLVCCIGCSEALQGTSLAST